VCCRDGIEFPIFCIVMALKIECVLVVMLHDRTYQKLFMNLP